VTDGEAFEEPVAPERCPACLAAIEPDQQYCLQCGERLAPAGPTPWSPFRGGNRPPAAAIVAGGAVLLLVGGFGIAYGFTRDDSPKAAGTTARTGPSTGAPVPPTLTITDTNLTVPTFTSTGTGAPFPTDTTPTFPTDTTPTFPTDTTVTTTPNPSTATTTGNEVNDWPSGRDAFAVLLASDDTERFTYASITAKKAKARSDGFSNAGVLNSDDYFTLNPGYWVLYLGPYSTKAAAQAAAVKARAAGYTDAYVRRVAE
jgi:hypothetical protein